MYSPRPAVNHTFLSLTEWDTINNWIHTLVNHFSLEVVHHPDKVYSHFRKEVTHHYGLISFLMSMILLVSIPIIGAVISYEPKSKFFWKYYTALKLRCTVNKGIFIIGIVILYLTWHDNNNDFLFLTKRMARIASSLMPLLMFLTLKPSPLPYTLHLRLLPLHKWISRIVVLQSLCHAIMYIYFYSCVGKLFKLTKIANIAGFICLFLFLMIGITSLPQIRRKSYRFFYAIHYPFAWLSILMLYIHSRPGVGLYTISCVSILSYQILFRLTHSSSFISIVERISPSLYIVTIPRNCLPKTFSPGSHLRILSRSIVLSPLAWLLPSHPYTIVSLPQDKEVKLLIKKTNWVVHPNKKYTLFGPFKSFKGKEFLGTHVPGINGTSLNYGFEGVKKVLFVCGGSSISVAIPLLRILEYRGIPYKLIWVIRDPRDAEILSYFNITNDVELYITEVDLKYRISRLVIKLNNRQEEESEIRLTPTKLQKKIENDPLLKGVQLFNDYNSVKSTLNSKSSIDESQSSCYDYIGRKFSSKTMKNSSEPNFTKYNNFDLGLDSDEESNQTEEKDDENLSIRIDTQGHYNRSIPPRIKKLPKDLKPMHKPEGGICLFKGRPILGCRLYDWFLDRGCCRGPTSNSSEPCCRASNVPGHDDDEKSKLWVIAAGPPGLVHQAEKWSNENKLKFHQELFSL